ncbi:MAG: glycoside hydrolase [Gemmatimonas sp.]|nr:glycoside hydrolase [Gemmatimonas sp.]
MERIFPLVLFAISLFSTLVAACGPAEAEDGAETIAVVDAALPSEAPEQPAANEPPAPDLEILPADPRENAPAQIRGIYLNASAAGTPDRLRALLDLADRTEINTFVVDIKTESGIHYRSQLPLARELTRPAQVTIESLETLVDSLHAHDIHAIARIVAFRDPVLVASRPAWAIRNPEGGIWVDREGNRWVSAWNPNAWTYNIDIAEEAARAGFDEVQFDYVRFPEAYQSLPTQIHPEAPAGEDKTSAIATFLKAARDRLHPLDVIVAADVFGMSMNGADDVGIGQQWERLAVVVDHLLPMVYPSHYFPTHLPNVETPNRMPRRTIEIAVGMGVIRNARITEAGVTPARIIPWLQAFDAPWVDRDYHYGPDQARAQIEGAYEVGLEDWIFWHPGSRYDAVQAAFETDLLPHARDYQPPPSLIGRMDRYEGWGMRASRERALQDR